MKTDNRFEFKAERRKIYRVGTYNPDAKNLYGKTLYDETTYRIDHHVTSGGPAAYTEKHPSGLIVRRIPTNEYFLLPDGWASKEEFDTDEWYFDEVVAIREDAPLIPCKWPSGDPLTCGECQNHVGYKVGYSDYNVPDQLPYCRKNSWALREEREQACKDFSPKAGHVFNESTLMWEKGDIDYE